MVGRRERWAARRRPAVRGSRPPGREALCSLEAERAVLGAILLDAESLPKAMEVLAPEHFYHSGHRKMFSAMVSLHERGVPVDAITLAEELRGRGELEEIGGHLAIATMVEEAATAAHLQSYAGIVREHAVKREVIKLAEGLATAAQNGSQATELVDQATDEVARLRRLIPESRLDVPLYDGADAWDFPAVQELVENLLPTTGTVWWGGLPKRYKSLFALYVCLGIACRRPLIAKKFLVREFPRILYVAREDGGSRIKERRDDILSAWGCRPDRGAIRFVIRPHFDLLNPDHVNWLRETCLRERITLLVLDTWTALSPTADPLGAKDQAQLAAVVVGLAEAINGLVVVVDHSRKNRPDGAVLSSADIFGPPQKWAAAEHIVMLDLTADGRRLEVFIEGKDMETRRFFLTVSPRGSGEEKFSYAGTVDEIAGAQRAVGDRNRQAVLAVLEANRMPLSAEQIADALRADAITLEKDTIRKHLSALVKVGQAISTGRGRATRYAALPELRKAPSSAKDEANDD